MSSMKTKKGFDCLAFKDRAQERIYEEIKELTVAEQVEYYNRRAERGPLGEWWRSLPRASTRASASVRGRTRPEEEGPGKRGG